MPRVVPGECVYGELLGPDAVLCTSLVRKLRFPWVIAL